MIQKHRRDAPAISHGFRFDADRYSLEPLQPEEAELPANQQDQDDDGVGQEGVRQARSYTQTVEKASLSKTPKPCACMATKGFGGAR